MARGGKTKKRKNDKKQLRHSRFKHPKKKHQTFRDIKHTDQYAQYKLKLENEKNKVKEVEENETEEMVVDDPFALLLSTFKNDQNKLLDNVAIDSDESSKSEEDDDDAEDENHLNQVEHLSSAEILTESLDQPKKSAQVDEGTDVDDEDYGDSNDEISNVESDNEDNDIEIDDSQTIEAEVNNKYDPFCIHLNYDLSESLLESLSNTPMNTKVSRLYWPVLHNLKVEIPIGTKKEVKQELVCIQDETEYAKEYSPPALIQTLNLDELFFKSQILKNVSFANKTHANVSGNELTELQKELLSIINNYQDLFYSERTFENSEEIRFIYCLHAVNHILKTRLKVIHHNSKLNKKSNEFTPDEFRDQGLVRPKVIIIVPFRDSCLKIVEMVCSILLGKQKTNIVNKKRFYDEFKGSELIMPKKNPKPEDYEQLFQGNIDDNFRIGLSFTKKSIKLYTDFYSSDMIIASPLGLRMVIGAEGDKERDFDFLASTEILILDQADVFLMQNWDHLLLIFENLHIQPMESHGTDFSRVRSWALNGWTKFYRQTLLFSSIVSSELNAVFNRKCFNYSGKIRMINPVEDSSICRVVVPLSHVFQKFKTNSALDMLDDRFRIFTEKIIPQYKDPIMTGVLIYVPSYFDYVRIRNYLKQSDFNFVQICEYSKDAKVARARDMFFHNEARILLYSERFHFFRRITLKGIRHIIFYQPPTFPNFYSEICNLMQEIYQNKFLVNDTMMTVSVLYCKYDIHQLAGIVKTTRAARMVSSDKDVHMFSTG